MEVNFYENRLLDIVERLISILEFDNEDYNENSSRTLSPSDNLKKLLLKTKSEININYAVNLVDLYNNIAIKRLTYQNEFLSLVKISSINDLHEKNINTTFDYIKILQDLVKLYNDWVDGEFKPIINSISSIMNDSLGSDDGISDLNPEILPRINKLVFDKVFKMSLYKDGGDKINSSDTFHISKQIGFSHDLTTWFNHIQKQKEFLDSQEEGKIFVSLYGKLDIIHPVYSNFLIILQKKDTIWIASDRVDIDNPYQQIARLGRRSLWDSYDEKLDNVDLPYNLFSDFDELNKTTLPSKINRTTQYEVPEFKSFFTKHYWDNTDKEKDVIKLKNLIIKTLNEKNIIYDTFKIHENYLNQQDYSVAIKKNGFTIGVIHNGILTIYGDYGIVLKNMLDLNNDQRTFLVLLIQQLITYYSSYNIDLDKIMLANEYTNNKLLEGTKINPVKTSNLSHWDEAHKIIFEELRETIEEGDKMDSAISLYTYDMVVNSSNYEPSWLASPKKLESLSEWLVLNDLSEKMKPKIKKLADLEKEAKKWLENQFKEKYDSIVEKLLVADEINFIGYDVTNNDGFSVLKSPSKAYYGSVEIVNGKGVDFKRGVGIGKYGYWDEDLCESCSNYTSTKVKKIKITHYKSLMFLLGFENRNELHPYMRQFRSAQNLPYKGNSNLDQTHPYNRLEDPMSRRNSNGLDIYLFMCRRCFNKKNKELNKEKKIEICL